MTTTPSGPVRYLLRSELRGFYGLSRGAIDNYQARGLLPDADGICPTGPLWSIETLRNARQYPDPRLAAVVPIDDELGRAEMDDMHVYMCPDRSGHHIGWTSPSMLALVEPGNLAQWRSIREIARYDGAKAIESSTADPAVQRYLDTARARRGNLDYISVYLLDETPLAWGRIRVSDRARTAGLQRARLLRRDGQRVGAPGAWLHLPTTHTTTPLPEFVVPLQETAFPRPDPDLSDWE